jgi:D-alanyl-D-alanine carboxypeptidase/D-alanyl-D-alanine-endopeptidase (penicillin-binding protein 4)
VYASTQPTTDGVIDGDLILYGRGAPDLDSKEGLLTLADQLQRRGVHRVRGSIIGDESYFRGEQYGTGWQWNDLQWYYGAQPSALSVDENAVEVTLGPGKKTAGPASVVITPNDSRLRLTNNATTGERDAGTTDRHRTRLIEQRRGRLGRISDRRTRILCLSLDSRSGIASGNHF